jgi:hypothetical protein
MGWPDDIFGTDCEARRTKANTQGGEQQGWPE